MKQTVVIVGRGKLAQAMLNELPKMAESKNFALDVIAYRENITLTAEAVVVHLGSGREYSSSLSLAIKSNASFIQAATEKDITMPAPTTGQCLYLNAPNLDIRLIKLFYWLKLGAGLFQNEEISIHESHQADKTSVPGTARKICDLLGVDYGKINSLREVSAQQKLGISNLAQHAYHEIVLGSANSQIKISTKIEGGLSYVAGLLEILQVIDKLSLANYEIEELVASNYL